MHVSILKQTYHPSSNPLPFIVDSKWRDTLYTDIVVMGTLVSSLTAAFAGVVVSRTANQILIKYGNF